ncbi:TPA: DUF1015 family protein [archaeon]|uniref:DUF1015 family protein n=1 Tax=Candidatus Naiadarchaeum limnaeum TaxID=2756139 RepID=A0A832VA94_9ARCH|nr:DUF1015 family protein [Candidatus Naiadarchaeum limnaeum]
MIGIRGFPAVVVSTNLSPTDRTTYINEISDKIKRPPRFTSLRAYFEKLLNKGILSKDTESLYLYQIKYRFPVEYGSTTWSMRTLNTFVALCSTRQLEPHEGESRDEIKKMKRSFEDAKIIVTPIMGMVQSIKHIIEELYSELKPGETDATVKIYEETFEENTPEPRGSTHTIWRVKDPKWIERVRRGLQRKKFAIITDGHHRYRALKELKKRFGYRWIPTVFVDLDDNNLALMSWHRLIKGIGKDEIAKTARQLMSPEFLHRHNTMLFKVDSLDDLRSVTHPAESIHLKVKRRVLPEYVSLDARKIRLPETEFERRVRTVNEREVVEYLETHDELAIEDQIPDEVKKMWPRHDISKAPFPTGAKLLIDRPFIEEVVEFPEEEIIAKSWEKGIYWEREPFKGHYQKFVVFGIYLIDKKWTGAKEEKFYFLSSGENIATFTLTVDSLIKDMVGEEDLEEKVKYFSEIGVAKDHVYNEKFRVAIFVPVIRKQDILYYIARKRPEYALPAKLTCFLPKPATALLMCDLNDLK